MNLKFWRNKRVLLTGHTGFKGAWTSLWLQSLGSRMWGYSLEPPTSPNLFELANIGDNMQHVLGDVRDMQHLLRVVEQCKPRIVIHMAAQSLVRRSYRDPVETYATNVLGTVNVLEVVRQVPGVKAVIIVTSDKCYENREWVWSYRENDRLGGYDPYSSSKACAELAIRAFRNSFFHSSKYQEHGVAVASVRAGNVIGGGDWAQDRLIPDIVRALAAGRPAQIRNPNAIRPWQHVLEPIAGYLRLAEKLWDSGPEFAEAWNFGPIDNEPRPVSWVVERICQMWRDGATWKADVCPQPHEAQTLLVDSSKSMAKLEWRPRWNAEQALDATIAWYKALQSGESMRQFSLRQIDSYVSDGQGPRAAKVASYA